MTSKPETLLIHRIHSRITPKLHRQKQNNAFTSGIPDVWYSGTKADLWVEYKYGDNTLSPLQKLWLQRRHAEGRNLAVIHCLTSGKNVLLEDSDMFLPVSTVKHMSVMDDDETAQWILSKTMQPHSLYVED